MRSRRVLGAIALLAVVVAAMCFAVVDVSTSAADACTSGSGCVVDQPNGAAAFAAVGVGALLCAGAALIAVLVLHRSSLRADADLEP